MASLFSKIIDREIPADIVYEDDLVIAFLDINPINEGHTLVVPKKRHADLMSLPAEAIRPYMERVQLVARAVMGSLEADGFHVMFNGGMAAHVTDHLHAHVIPRFEGDGHEEMHGEGYESDEAKKRCAERIRSKIDA